MPPVRFPASSPSRRVFLIAGAAVAVTGCGGPGPADRQLAFASLPDALRELDRLKDAVPLDAAANWTWSKTLLHCAQSIDYSISGYPAAKPAIFQHTAGAAAFSFFRARGRMSHNLIEAIPGAAMLDANARVEVAAAALHKSVAAFLAHGGTLQPHFAYGALSKADYERAHAMHIANHLSVFDAKKA